MVANTDQKVNAFFCRVSSNFPVHLGGKFAQFSHEAQERHASAFHIFENIQRSLGRNRIGVVYIIQQCQTVFQTHDGHTVFGRHEVFNAPFDLIQCKVHFQSYCHRRKSIQHHVCAWHRNHHVHAALRCVNGASGMFQTNGFDVVRVNIPFVFHTKPAYFLGQFAVQCRQHIVITVQHSNILFIHKIEQFTFCFQNAFPTAQMFNMRNANIGNDADMRTYRIHQTMDFTKMVHAHFNDSRFMTFFQTEQCQRHTEVIIEISQCPQSIVFLRKDRSNHILCGSLAHTAGDAHNGNIKQAAVIFCQLQHSRSRVFHQKQHTAIFRCHFTLCKTCGNAFFHTAFQVIMAVGIFAFQRHKEAFFPCLTGILCHMADGFLLCLF